MTGTTLNNELKNISDVLLNKKENFGVQRNDSDNTKHSEKNEEPLRLWRENLIEIFAISIQENQDETFEKLKDWGKEGVNLLVNLNLPLDLAIEEVRFYRDLIGDVLKQEAIKHNFSIEIFYEIISRFDAVVDRAVHWLSISYSRSYSLRMSAAEANALELSIPIIRVKEDIGVLPLIGDLDTRRAQELMNKALREGTKFNLSYFIIDLSGVPIIDTMVADQIFKVIDALMLTGIKSILTGIRPEIAQTIVHLGIDLNQKGITIFSSLHQALKNL